jgi:hypothetical protein
MEYNALELNVEGAFKNSEKHPSKAEMARS